MMSAINRNILLPAYLSWNRDCRLKRLKELERLQWSSKDEIQARQFDALRRLVAFAYDNVPFYRDRFEAVQVCPDDIKSPEDVQKLPVLRKKDLQENSSAMLSGAFPASRIYQDASGGSTGQPTIFFGDKDTLFKKYAAVLMTDKWTGWNVGDKSAYLWGADREVNVIRSLKHRLVERHIYRHEILNAFSMTVEKMHAFAERMLREKPTLVVAYSNVAYQFAQFVKENGISMPPLKGIVCSAETLSEEKRRLIESVFGCKVFNRYGSREVGLIASECELQQGLHINAIDLYVELSPIAAESEGRKMGEVIVTDLMNYAMPLIRYNMGDIGLVCEKQCDCGRGLPMLKHVIGRSSDFIVHPDGRLIHGEFFSHAFYGIGGISQFQIIQKTLNSLEIKVVTKQGLSPEDRSHLTLSLQEFLNDQVDITVLEVDDIPVPASGKFRFAISHVALNSTRSPEPASGFPQGSA